MLDNPVVTTQEVCPPPLFWALSWDWDWFEEIPLSVEHQMAQGSGGPRRRRKL